MVKNATDLKFSDNKNTIQTDLQTLVDSQVGRNNVHEIALSVSTGNSDSAIHISGSMEQESASSQYVVGENTPYFSASTSKLFATVMVLQLVDEKKLSLDDAIVTFFPQGTLDGLHVLKGVDSTADISVRQLLAHTSGIANYFGDKLPDGTQFSDTMLNNQDSAWTVNDVIETVKGNLSPHFSPGTKGKAHYSDTNFQILGAIIENVTQKSLAENISIRITTPLDLQNTYLFTAKTAEDQSAVLPLRFKQATLDIPMAMESVRLDGGIVSTSADSLTFIQAFMQGKLFDQSHLDDIQQWNSIGFPLQAGVGILKFSLPRVLTLFSKPQVLIGHSGISGAFAFYSPTSNVYIAGTLNQLDNQTLPFKFLLKVLGKAKTN